VDPDGRTVVLDAAKHGQAGVYRVDTITGDATLRVARRLHRDLPEHGPIVASGRR
jgi:hypothetical protein